MQSNELQPNQQRALELAWKGCTVSDIAQELGVHRTTVWRWTQDPEFIVLLNQLRSETRSGIARELEQASIQSVTCLRDIVDCPDTAKGHRIRAAVSILDRAGFSPSAANGAPVTAPSPNRDLVDPFTDDGMASIVQELAKLPLGLLAKLWQQVSVVKGLGYEQCTGQVPHELTGGASPTNQREKLAKAGT